jgi:hypothetical protein
MGGLDLPQPRQSAKVSTPRPTVPAAQEDLVEIVAQFDPKIVRMCGDGSMAED